MKKLFLEFISLTLSLFKTLYEKVNSEVQDRSSQSPTESPFSALGAIQHTREILTSTTKTTRSVIANVSDTAWWKKTLQSIHPAKQGRHATEWDDMNSKMEKQGIHPFYGTIIANSYSNKVSKSHTCSKFSTNI